MGFAEILLNFCMWLIRMIFLPAKLYFILQRRKYCPPIVDDVLKMPALKLAEKIRKKELTSLQVVQSYIARVKVVNPVINAVVKDRFQEALEEAKYVDKVISSGEMSEEEMKTQMPFLGVPFTVKESVPVQGMTNRAGSLIHVRDCAEKDDKMVEQLKKAGGIPILVSNTPELCMNWETCNKLTGRTKNPYDTRRTCGGSSGGEAALLGAAASVIGLGSDLGGSLRLPPHFCCVWGHKPTPRALYHKGHFPNCEDDRLWPEVFTLGPMSRYAVDLPILLDVICTEEARPKLNLTEKVDLRNIKIYYMENDGGSSLTNRVDREIVEGMRKFVNYLKTTHGIHAQKLTMPEMKYSPAALYSLLQLEGTTPPIKEGKSAGCELFKFYLGLSKVTYTPLLHAVFQPIVKKCATKSKIEAVDSNLENIRSKLLQILGDDGVLLYPVFPKSAHYHNEIYYKVFDTSYMAIFNVFRLPSTSCTMGLNSRGLPMGIQAVTSPYNDRLSLRVAEEIEIALGGWKPPPSKVKRRSKVSSEC